MPIFSHNPLHLPAILEGCRECDVVIGSRYIRDGRYDQLAHPQDPFELVGQPLRPFYPENEGSGSDFGIPRLPPEVLEDIAPEKVRSNGYSFLVEMLFRAQRKNARVLEVPIVFFDRTMGASKISRREIWLSVFTIFASPLRPFA